MKIRARWICTLIGHRWEWRAVKRDGPKRETFPGLDLQGCTRCQKRGSWRLRDPRREVTR